MSSNILYSLNSSSEYFELGTLNYFIMESTEEFLKNKGFTVKMFSGTQWDPCNDTTISW